MKSEPEQTDENCIVRARYCAINERCIVMPRPISLINTIEFSVCAVCSAQANRAQAKFCSVCGHDLREDYAPLDSLRASYNLRKQSVSPLKSKDMVKLFSEDRNNPASTAMAFVIYSLVPYLGILFCPGALVFGGISLATSLNKPQLGGKQTAVYSLVLGSIIFVIQILLWWLLYLIPELNG